MFRVYAASLLIFLCLPATANAGWKIDRAQAIAEHVWHYEYGCETVAVTQDDPARTFSGEALATYVTQGREPLAWTSPTAPDRCAIHLNATRIQRWGMSWTEVCGVLIHEYGHLAGYWNARGVRQPDGTIDHQHSPNPRSIMSPDYSSDRRCRKRGRPYLERYDL